MKYYFVLFLVIRYFYHEKGPGRRFPKNAQDPTDAVEATN